MRGITVQVTLDGRVLLWHGRFALELEQPGDVADVIALLEEAGAVQRAVVGDNGCKRLQPATTGLRPAVSAVATVGTDGS